jgi:hypothetical protein
MLGQVVGLEPEQQLQTLAGYTRLELKAQEVPLKRIIALAMHDAASFWSFS